MVKYFWSIMKPLANMASWRSLRSSAVLLVILKVPDLKTGQSKFICDREYITAVHENSDPNQRQFVHEMPDLGVRQLYHSSVPSNGETTRS